MENDKQKSWKYCKRKKTMENVEKRTESIVIECNGNEIFLHFQEIWENETGTDNWQLGLQSHKQ